MTMLFWLIEIARAEEPVATAKAINVCNSFFNFIRVLPCAGDASATDENSSVVGLIINLVNFLLTISAAVAMVMIVYAGVQLIGASADPERAKEAKKLISSAILGLVIVMFALIITSTINLIITKAFA